MLRNTDQQNGRRTNAPTRSTVSSDEILGKLRSLTSRSESQSNPRPPTVRDLEQRLVQMRAEITEIVRKEARSLCNCRQITLIAGETPEQVEADFELTCPVHGLRTLGVIVHLGTLPPEDDDRRIDELIKTRIEVFSGVRRQI